MNSLKLIIIALVAGNILLFGLEASKAPAVNPGVALVEETTQENLPGITLLSELSGEEGAAGLRQCFTVGPFESEPTAEAIVDMLGEYASSVRHRRTEAFVDRGYWVYLPPFEDEAAARDAVNVLYDAGVEDVALIRNGEWNHSVSLGYFINQANATSERDRIRSLGFEAEFRIQRDDESRYWVDYEQQAGVEYASRVLTGLIPAELHRDTACGQNHAETDAGPG